MIYAAEQFMQPIYAEMKKELLKSAVIHADETVVQVLSEPNRKAKTDSRMWVAEHSYSDWAVTLAPTSKRSGEESRKCVHCGNEETRTVAALSEEDDNSNNGNSGSVVIIVIAIVVGVAAGCGCTVMVLRKRK